MACPEKLRYRTQLLARLADRLRGEFGKGFDVSNRRFMRLFYQAFPNCEVLRHNLTWTRYRTLLRVEDVQVQQWYLREAASQNWSVCALERQINILYYEGLLGIKARKGVCQEAQSKVPKLDQHPSDCVRAPVMHVFLGFPEVLDQGAGVNVRWVSQGRGSSRSCASYSVGNPGKTRREIGWAAKVVGLDAARRMMSTDQ